MKSRIALLFLLTMCGFILTAATKTNKSKSSSEDQEPVIDEPAPEATATPSPTPTLEEPSPTPTPFKTTKSAGPEKALVVHKPMPNPAWGKVIQYHREQNFALSESNREVFHEFLFQDENGVIRTAIFHENSTGGGYWEVWVWDQQ